jgi:hypothetical protein
MLGASILTAVTLLLPATPGPSDSLPGCLWPGPSRLLMNLPSPPDSVLVTLGGGRAKICYSRPSVRGRKVFDSLVEFGKRWRTGANEPTMLFLTSAASVAGVALQPGAYVIMTIPGPERWTVLLNTASAPTPAEMFNALVEVGRGEVAAEPLETTVEQLTIRAEPDASGAMLILEWERTRIRIPLHTR